MGLTDQEIITLRNAITSCCRPIILFDDDTDGLSSFLMIYNLVREGRGVPVKNSPEVQPKLAKIVNDYSPDLIIILDMPMVSQEFLDKVSARVIWIDHHTLQSKKKVEYFNPMATDIKDNRPTSYWTYRAVQSSLWIGMCGMIGDWFMPEDKIRLEYSQKYPTLLPENITDPAVALHETKLGLLIRVFEFNMKGKTNDVIQSVKVFTRIREPMEILEQTTPAGKYLYKKFKKLEDEYQNILKDIIISPNEKLLLVKYASNSVSFSTQISNALMHKYHNKLIIVAWQYDGEYKCSLRTTTGHNLPLLIENALQAGVRGYGGGHERAAGACIKSDDFDKFVQLIKEQI